MRQYSLYNLNLIGSILIWVISLIADRNRHHVIISQVFPYATCHGVYFYVDFKFGAIRDTNRLFICIISIIQPTFCLLSPILSRHCSH